MTLFEFSNPCISSSLLVRRLRFQTEEAQELILCMTKSVLIMHYMSMHD